MADEIKNVKEEKEKIAYHFTMARRTGDDEQITVQFNGEKDSTQEELQKRVDMLGEIMYNRMVWNNNKILDEQKRLKEKQVNDLFKSNPKPQLVGN